MTRRVAFSTSVRAYTGRGAITAVEPRDVLVAGAVLWGLLLALRCLLHLGPWVSAPVLGLLVLAFAAYLAGGPRIIPRNNTALGQIRRGELEPAQHALVSALTGVTTPAMAYVLLCNLGNIALRRGDFVVAVELYEAAHRFAGGRPAWLPALRVARTRSEQALALCGAGRHAEAAALVEQASPVGEVVVARALLELHEGRPQAALAQLDAARPVVRRGISGLWAALADALTVLCRQRLDEIYRGQPRHRPLHYGEATRALVEKLLPGASSALA